MAPTRQHYRLVPVCSSVLGRPPNRQVVRLAKSRDFSATSGSLSSHRSKMADTPDPASSSEDELVVQEIEPAAPKKAEPGTRAAGTRPAILPATSSTRFPPHEHVIDADEQQWVYYSTMVDGEVVGAIASAFDSEVDEVIQFNARRYHNMSRKSKLKEGTLLIIGACDALLMCSACRGDQSDDDKIIICRGDW